MLIITNPGLVDPMAFHLIGASSKRNDQSTIGFFGSGLKYSLAGLLRKNIPLQVWRGTEFMDITTEEVTMRDNTYKRIIIDGVPTSFTTDMGPKWETWMFIRELYANAIDEGGEMAVTDDYQPFIKEGHTTIILPEITKELQSVLDEQDILFCRGREVLYEDDHIKVYDEVGDGGLYVKGILVSRQAPGFGYELKDEPYSLNEERQVLNRLTAHSQTIGAIFTINDPKMVRRIVSRTRNQGSLEHSLLCEGYVTWADHTSSAEAWHKYLFIPSKKSDFAKDPDHLVVSSDVYEKIKHPRKWEATEWERVDRGKESLDQAIAILEGIVPGDIPRGEWWFGRPESTALGISCKNGANFVNESWIGEAPKRLAAIIAAHLSASDHELGIRIIHNLIK